MNTYEPHSNNKNRILGLLPVAATYTKNLHEPDLILAGKYGCIWKYDDKRYVVMVDSPSIANKHFKLKKGEKLTKGEEYGFLADEEEAKKWVGILKIPNNRKSQVKHIMRR